MPEITSVNTSINFPSPQKMENTVKDWIAEIISQGNAYLKPQAFEALSRQMLNQMTSLLNERI